MPQLQWLFMFMQSSIKVSILTDNFGINFECTYCITQLKQRLLTNICTVMKQLYLCTKSMFLITKDNTMICNLDILLRCLLNKNLSLYIHVVKILFKL